MKKPLVFCVLFLLSLVQVKAQPLNIINPAISGGTQTNSIITTPTITTPTITGGTFTGGTVTTTDLSAANVLPSGGTIKRTLSNKFNEILSVTDFGAIMSGTSHTLASLGYTTLAAAQVPR